MDTIQLIGSTMGLGFVAGIRLYSTVLVLGLGLRLGWLHLPPAFDQHAAVLTNPFLLAAAGIAYLAEFFADKVPWVDTLWDGFHSFVRPLGAVLLAAATIGHIDPSIKLLAIVLCGGVAFSSHSSKMLTRFAVNHSPEPFSNIGLSLGEDLIAPVGVWLSLKHPVLVLSLVSVFLLVFLWVFPKAVRVIRVNFVALWLWITRNSAARAQSSCEPANMETVPVRELAFLARQAASVPSEYEKALRDLISLQTPALGVRCVATKTVKRLCHSIGYLVICRDEIIFVTRRNFRYRTHRISLKDIHGATLKRGFLINKLIVGTPRGEITFQIFKNTAIGDSADLKTTRMATA